MLATPSKPGMLYSGNKVKCVMSAPWSANRAIWRVRLIAWRYYWYYAKACGLSKVAEIFKAFARS